MMESVRTATHPVSPAPDKRGTSAQIVQKVCQSLCEDWLFVCLWAHSRSFIYLLHNITISSAVMMFTLTSPSRAFPDHTTNMCVKVSGGFLCRSAEWCVWGLPFRLFTVCGRSALQPLSELSQSSVVLAGWTMCPRVCQVKGHYCRSLFVVSNLNLFICFLFYISIFGGNFLPLNPCWHVISKETKKKKKNQQRYLLAMILTFSPWCLWH